MLRRSLLRRVTIHSPRGIPFTLSKEEAMEKIKGKYDGGWFTTGSDYINFNSIAPEFIPFFLCSGEVNCVYKATLEYQTTYRDSNGNTRTRSNYTYLPPAKYSSTFEENNTFVHASYKYNNKHIQSTLSGPDMANNLVRVKNMDMSEGKINMFEMSTTTMRSVVSQQLRTRIEAEVSEHVRSSTMHRPNSIRVDFDFFHVKMAHATPAYVPAFVVDATYDGTPHTMFVNGFNGNPGGPYLLSSVMLGRIGTSITVGTMLMVMPNKVYGLAMGSILGVVAYYVGFYAAKKFPEWRHQYVMGQQEREQTANEQDDADGYRPQPDSERTDDRAFHEKNQRRAESEAAGKSSSWSWGSNNKGKERLEREYEESKKRSKRNEARTERRANDAKGYYALLRVDPNASINEIRAAYRTAALCNHPDQGGSPEKMKEINEAYRVLRDVKRRSDYDRQG